MSEPEQCIICLDSLLLPRNLHVAAASTTPGPDAAAALSPAAPATTTNGHGHSEQNDGVNGDDDDDSNNDSDVNGPNPLSSNGNDTENCKADHQVHSHPNSTPNHLSIVAALDGCNHIIHDACIRSWAQKTNTCPICRNTFHTVRVFNGVDDTTISTYTVQDRKQVAEFDLQQWLGENDNAEEETEQSRPCPICESAEREDVLLLCDSCDAAYHTHCIGLDGIPDGDWYCMECRHLFQLADEDDPSPSAPQHRDPPRSARTRNVSRPNPRDVRGFHVRTRARLRRARQQARNVEWQGAWGQFAGRFYDLSELDLDNQDEEDEELEQFRRFQQLDRRELHRWQQRMDIANRLGARDAFANNIPPQITEHLHPPPPVEETVDERRAWGAFERARDTEDATTSNSRKRKARSVTASPAEPPQEPERKLKRPRTRRLPMQQGEASGSTSSPVTTSVTAAPTSSAAGLSTAAAWTDGNSTAVGSGEAAAAAAAAGRSINEPALVSSLLKELEPQAPSEDETGATSAAARRATIPDASSPVLSPSPSNHSSPRAMSMTPPPLLLGNERPTSPTLSLSTHIEPRYPPANYSPNRNSCGGSGSSRTGNGTGNASGSGSGSDHSDSENRPSRRRSRNLELRQPRPRRGAHPIMTRIQDNSPNRSTVMTQEEKKKINDIVKSALRPHWRAQKLTSEQYATINRDISRKLYEEVTNANALNDDAKRSWEHRVTQEVAQAVAGLSV
ncbi:PHD-finger [Geosmithia morbida]|uniref:PHD-finger n=1 Tax=Geosmithia morbida TaxID=1094350 RepID=A0A9P4YQN1_9HYPO|nr:PHD-finger [Geosmithia morbida]KAF4121343.1 PHD-finger [Geosmithia morbida]